MNTIDAVIHTAMSLSVEAGHATHCGKRPRNEDFVGMVTPAEPDLSNKGLIAALADGVSGNDGGRQAAEYSVRGLLTDYYATPDTWPVTQALERVIKGINGWVQRQGSTRAELAGMASTLTSVVLRGRFYYFAHVGDSRLYLLRDGALRRLTTDHVWDRPEMHHVLTRAVGLDSRIAIDLGMGQVQTGDVFLLATDGIWAAIPEYDLAAHLCQLAGHLIGAEHAAQALVKAALAAGGTDNASAIALRIDALPSNDLRDAVQISGQLPVPPRLKPGKTIDGYLVETEIHASHNTLLYQIIDTRLPPGTPRKLVLKTLRPERADSDGRAAFAHEEWLARRVVARFFPQVVTPEQRTYLYYLTTFHEGHTLRERIDAGAHLTVPDILRIGQKLTRAIGALHRRSILHRDIKPDNVHLGDDGELRILDLGVSQSGFDTDVICKAPQAGTPSFLAPEQFDNAAPSPQTDLYAAGVTLYWALTRHYPYGEVEPFQHPRFTTPTAPTRYRPDLPMWLEDVLLKAVARDPSDRFETAEEMLLALERGAAGPPSARRPVPLVNRDPTMFWRVVAIASLTANFLLAYFIAIC
jgi:serine/threonine protein phosphatase PrpC